MSLTFQCVLRWFKLGASSINLCLPLTAKCSSGPGAAAGWHQQLKRSGRPACRGGHPLQCNCFAHGCAASYLIVTLYMQQRVQLPRPGNSGAHGWPTNAAAAAVHASFLSRRLATSRKRRARCAALHDSSMRTSTRCGNGFDGSVHAACSRRCARVSGVVELSICARSTADPARPPSSDTDAHFVRCHRPLPTSRTTLSRPRWRFK